MTDYHPVTKEELEYIREEGYQDHCISISRKVDEILSRPDPLALLQKWIEWRENHVGYPPAKMWEVMIMIEKLRTNPSAVREQGIEQGWWKE